VVVVEEPEDDIPHHFDLACGAVAGVKLYGAIGRDQRMTLLTRGASVEDIGLKVMQSAAWPKLGLIDQELMLDGGDGLDDNLGVPGGSTQAQVKRVDGLCLQLQGELELSVQGAELGRMLGLLLAPAGGGGAQCVELHIHLVGDLAQEVQPGWRQCRKAEDTYGPGECDTRRLESLDGSGRTDDRVGVEWQDLADPLPECSLPLEPLGEARGVGLRPATPGAHEGGSVEPVTVQDRGYLLGMAQLL
jgi:hypothetical protein